jgi:hypothetical protein
VAGRDEHKGSWGCASGVGLAELPELGIEELPPTSRRKWSRSRAGPSRRRSRRLLARGVSPGAAGSPRSRPSGAPPNAPSARPPRDNGSPKAVRALVAALGETVSALRPANPVDKADAYGELGITSRSTPRGTAQVEARPRLYSGCVGGATRTLTPRAPALGTFQVAMRQMSVAGWRHQLDQQPAPDEPRPSAHECVRRAAVAPCEGSFSSRSLRGHQLAM